MVLQDFDQKKYSKHIETMITLQGLRSAAMAPRLRLHGIPKSTSRDVGGITCAIAPLGAGWLERVDIRVKKISSWIATIPKTILGRFLDRVS